MKSRCQPPLSLVVWAWVALASLTVGCADKANPVLPSTTPPGGKVSGSSSDDGGEGEVMAPFDTGEGRADAAMDIVLDTVLQRDGDASFGSCNPLKQDCPGTPQRGCYPDPFERRGQLSASRRQPGAGELRHQPRSLRLLARAGLRAHLPSRHHRALLHHVRPRIRSACGIGSVCAPVPGIPASSNIGYCQ